MPAAEAAPLPLLDLERRPSWRSRKLVRKLERSLEGGAAVEEEKKTLDQQMKNQQKK